MKKLLFVVVLFCFAFTANAQKYFNVYMGAEGAKTNGLFSQYIKPYTETQFLAPIGVEYYHNKWKFSVGYSYGKIYRPQSEVFWYYNNSNSYLHYYSRYTNTIFQVPFTIGFDMQNNRKSPFQVFLLAGYSYGAIYKSTNYLYKDNPNTITDTERYKVYQKLQYLSVGMEGRYIYKNFLVSGTFQLKDRYQAKDYRVLAYSLWSAAIKVGYIFGRK